MPAEPESLNVIEHVMEGLRVDSDLVDRALLSSPAQAVNDLQHPQYLFRLFLVPSHYNVVSDRGKRFSLNVNSVYGVTVTSRDDQQSPLHGEPPIFASQPH